MQDLPSLLTLSCWQDYRSFYENHYCRAEIITADGIRVYFSASKFNHAFYESSKGKSKNEFSQIRAERMPWIAHTLKHPDASLYQGWISATKTHDPARRVSVVYGDFVVVIDMSVNQRNQLKANFVTCYVADNSIDRIRKSPVWSRDECLCKLGIVE
ncbi:hypothetical protein SAMN05660772_01269 [Pasteurella testudinis DSM 23072]|uniref:Uncharacterized protein n=1 Tax=Pasteurella testudinis DSM 23072 TaxID=1122938 RepID=A0A1W1V6Q8_9PAST|nr:hypothetical protein [Pasteurella testudinis]SMB89022.1 hypothetical protein SAMN05660772_01269 [Pasteurella testudinis DSM 23072]SUB50222.1 Uncharacterised protein [Pasteurella testudinis]